MNRFLILSTNKAMSILEACGDFSPADMVKASNGQCKAVAYIDGITDPMQFAESIMEWEAVCNVDYETFKVFNYQFLLHNYNKN